MENGPTLSINFFEFKKSTSFNLKQFKDVIVDVYKKCKGKS